MKFGKTHKKGGDISIFLIAITVTFVTIFVLLFSICVMYINMYSIVYNYKMDLYNLNRSAIVSVNKVEGKYGIYNYDKNVYFQQFKELLKKTYGLNDNLQNSDKFIEKIEILEYDIYTKGSFDNVTHKVVQEDIIHVLTTITYQPIIFKSIFENNCTFTIHNDISIKMYD